MPGIPPLPDLPPPEERPPWLNALLEIVVALHVGTVIYGNIGAADRLDFTVIGPAVNLVSRIEAIAKTLDLPIVVSDEFAGAYGRPLRSLGTHQLRGLAAHGFKLTIHIDQQMSVSRWHQRHPAIGPCRLQGIGVGNLERRWQESGSENFLHGRGCL